MPTDCDAIIIGAGASGLAIARTLEASGLSVYVLEQATRVGASWWDRYEGLRLNTVRWLSDLPFSRMSAHAGRWPTREEWATYLERYGADLEHVVLGVKAHRLEKRSDGWHVETSAGSFTAQFVVVATGHDRVPHIPDWPGKERFTGRLLHSSEFQRPEDLSGNEVLVVGTGNSGVEIATLLASAKHMKVSISMRTPPLLLKREIGGIPITLLAELGRVLPDAILDWFGRNLHQWLWSDLASYGLANPAKRLSAMRHTYYSPPLDSGFAAALRRGAIEVTGEVARFEGASVILQGGASRNPDVVIAATGFRPGLEELVGHLGVLDERGEPKVTAGEQIPEAAGLFFAGFRFGLFALLPYLEGDAQSIANAISKHGSRGWSLRRPLKLTPLTP